MRGIVKIDDGRAVHVIPRAEVRYAEVISLAGYAEGWALRYQLVGMTFFREIEWRGESRPAALKTEIDVGEYTRIAAGSVHTMIPRGQRALHLERRADNVFLVRSGLVEDDVRVVLCRKFIAEMAMTSLLSVRGMLDEQLLREIQDAARDLVLPDWYPLKEEVR
jgi:hypothetical protein